MIINRKLNLLLLQIMVVISSMGTTTAQEYYWEIRDEMPNSVANSSSLLIRDDIIVLGGFSYATQAPVNWIQSYNPSSMYWQEISNLIYSRLGHVSVNYEGAIYTLGGIHNADSTKNTLEKWNLTDSPTIVAVNDNFDRIFASGEIVGDNLYIVGGREYLYDAENSRPYILEYSISKNTITWREDSLNFTDILPEQQMTATLGNDIYIFGGVYNGIKNSIFKFNTETHKFEVLPITLQEPRASGQAVAFEENNQILIIGGYNENGSALSSVEVFTVIDNEYTIEYSSPLNYARSSFTAIKKDDEVYVLGGYDAEFQLIKEMEVFTEATTALDVRSVSANEFELYQNYPNPFNPSTEIRYNLPVNSFVRLKIFDLMGKEITTLVNQKQNSGSHKVNFEANQLSSGVYFYRLTFDGQSITKKMMLLR